MVGPVADVKAMVAAVRELHALGATHVRVGDIEATFPPKPPERERVRPMEAEEREELNRLRSTLRREEEALSA